MPTNPKVTKGGASGTLKQALTDAQEVGHVLSTLTNKTEEHSLETAGSTTEPAGFPVPVTGMGPELLIQLFAVHTLLDLELYLYYT